MIIRNIRSTAHDNTIRAVLAAIAHGMIDELSRVLPAGGFWGLELQSLRLSLLKGEHRPVPRLDWIGRMGLQPAGIRTLCKAGLDNNERLDPLELSRERFSTPTGSLIAGSISAVHGAWAFLDGDDQQALTCWQDAFIRAETKGYVLLVCDAPEAIACLAGRAQQLERAACLLAGAQQLREETSYAFRFDYEQTAVDRLKQAVAAAGAPQTLRGGPTQSIKLAYDYLKNHT